jgi:uncharacterized membrane protein
MLKEPRIGRNNLSQNTMMTMRRMMIMTIITIRKYLEILLTIYMKKYELKKNGDHSTLSVEKKKKFQQKLSNVSGGHNIYIFILQLE